MQKHFYRLIASAAAAAMTVAQLTSAAQVASAKKEKEPVYQTSETSTLERTPEVSEVAEKKDADDASKGVTATEPASDEPESPAEEPLIVSAELISSETSGEETLPTESTTVTETTTTETTTTTAETTTETSTTESTATETTTESAATTTAAAETTTETRMTDTTETTAPAVFVRQKPDFSKMDACGTLSEAQTQTLAALIFETISNHAAKLDLASHPELAPIGIDQINDVTAVFQTVIYSCREGILTDGGYRYQYNLGNQSITGLTFTYRVPTEPAEMYESAYQIACEKLDMIESKVDPSWSAPEIALYFHDYMAVHYNYDYETLDIYRAKGEGVPASDPCFTAYGLLEDGVAVCQGYAGLYNILLNECGVESYIVTSNENNHAWNAVRLDGVFYQIDVTWDDSAQLDTQQFGLDGQVSHDSFLKSPVSMVSSGHSFDSKDWELSTGELIADLPYSNQYNYGFWTNSRAAIYPYMDGWLVKEPDPLNRKAASYSLYTYDYETNEAEWLYQIASEADNWYADINKGQRYSDNYSVGCVDEDGILYYTTNSGIMAVAPRAGGGKYDFVWVWLFGLDEEEAKEGFIYGMHVEGNKIYYQLAPKLNGTPIQHSRDMTEFRKQIAIASGAPSGDLDGDCEISVTDVVNLHQFLNGVLQIADSNVRKRADLDGDGIIDILDLAKLKWLVLNK